MKFRNIAPDGASLSFSIDDARFEVPPGATFNVPDHIAFAVTKMGILAEPVGTDEEELEKATRPDPAPPSAPTEKPTSPTPGLSDSDTKPQASLEADPGAPPAVQPELPPLSKKNR